MNKFLSALFPELKNPRLLVDDFGLDFILLYDAPDWSVISVNLEELTISYYSSEGDYQSGRPAQTKTINISLS